MSQQERNLIPKREQTFLVGLKADPESFSFEVQIANGSVLFPQEFYLIGDFKCSRISNDIAKNILGSMNIDYPSDILGWELVSQPLYIKNI